MIKILVADPIHQSGIDAFSDWNDFEVTVKLKMNQEELIEAIGSFDALVVRSETQVTAAVIEAGHRLQVVGRAGVGVDNIDLDAATRHGVAVVNAPTGNILAAAEHTIAMLMSLARNVPQADASLKRGEWRRGDFVGTEVRGKTLGIIGLGRVGSEVARKAIGLDMKVKAFDPFVVADYAARLGVEVVAFDQVLANSDFLTLHTPLTSGTRQLLGAEELGQMKKGAKLLNVARGELVDEEALFTALESGQLSGAGLDVFSQEPPSSSPLLNHPGVVLTPHLGASTVEAQIEVAREVMEQIRLVLNRQPAQYTVNLPFVDPDVQEMFVPYLQVAVDVGKIAIQLSGGEISSVAAFYQGEIGGVSARGLKNALLMGMLQPTSDERVNLVNSNLLAERRGLEISEDWDPTPLEQYASVVTLEISAPTGVTRVSGTHIRGKTHLVRIGDDWMDATLEIPYLLLIDHRDQPGFIGSVGSIAGRHDINIAFMVVGRQDVRGRATMVVGLDDPMPDNVLAEISTIPNLDGARLVRLSF